MGGRAHLRMSLLDPPVAADDIRDAPGILGLLRVTRTIGETDRSFGVAQEREWKLELPGKGEIFGGRIEADTEDDGALRQIPGMKVAEPAALIGSPRSVRFGIKPEDDILPFVIRQPNGAALVVRHREFRCRFTDFEHFGPPE